MQETPVGAGGSVGDRPQHSEAVVPRPTVHAPRSTPHVAMAHVVTCMIHTIRDLTDARRLVLQSLWWQRVVPPNVATVRNALGWARTLLSSGEPIPPPG